MARRRNDIERYLSGEMTPSEMHALEREAMNDPFLAEALEGIDETGKDSFLFDLKQLNNSVRQRTSLRKPKMISMWNWSIGIAAGLIILALSSVYIISIINSDKKRELLAEKKETTEPKTAPIIKTDSVSSASGDEEKKPDSKPDVKPAKIKDNKPVVTPPTENPIATNSSEKPSSAEKPSTTTTEPVAIASQPEAETPAAKTAEADNDLAVKSDGGAAKDDIAASKGATRAADKKSLAAPMTRRSGTSRVYSAHGKVTSAEDNSALPGVNVVIKGTSVGTITDLEGNFQIELPNEETTLVFSFIGLESVETEANASESLNVMMTTDQSQLSEVVVAGYDEPQRSDIETFEMAQPEGGKKAFKRYLENKIEYPIQAIQNKIEGKVTIEFFVEIDGQLKDFKVLKGLGYGCDDEVIRAVKSGPRWSPSKRNSQPKKDKIRLRYRFDLGDKK
jgi:TonB family protein